LWSPSQAGLCAGGRQSPRLRERNGGATGPEEPSGPPRTSPNEADRPAPRARQRDPIPARPLAQVMKGSDSLRSGSRAAPERDPDDGLEPGLDRLVDHADDAVQLRLAQMLQRHPTDEVEVAVGADGEARAVHRVVPPE